MASYKVSFSVFGFLFAALMVSRRPSPRHRQWLLGFRRSALNKVSGVERRLQLAFRFCFQCCLFDRLLH
ncbi:hypothetical protein HanPSC8_Chr08g0315251 [Helianthus annuus]|nr:hypothetical protein HanPSC8_Chr08g0315251 [Helianthus annuus]